MRPSYHVLLAVVTVFSCQTYGPSILWHPSIALVTLAVLTFASWMVSEELIEALPVLSRRIGRLEP